MCYEQQPENVVGEQLHFMILAMYYLLQERRFSALRRASITTIFPY